MLLGMHQAGHVGTHERRAAATRRSALTAAGLAVVGAGVLGASACSPQKSPQPSSPRLPDNALITLGVAAGPPPTPSRVGISSVLKIGRDLYVIDCGLGSLNAFTNAGLQFDDLKAMFITHLHTDHIVDYYNFFLSGGFLAPPGRAPVLVYGPGPAGGLPPSEVGNPNPATVNPANPTPGLAAATEALHRAFAYTSNIFIRDYGIDNVADLVKVTEIGLPPGSDYRNRAPKMSPFSVASDDNVSVTATLVSHYDVYPAFGFRFDLKKSGVSVTFSGDTTKSDNLITLAQGTDILVHEAVFSLDTAYFGNAFPPNYLVNSHTSAEQVGEVAAAAKPKQLILRHYAPDDLPDSQWLDKIKKNYSGMTTIARDGQVFAL
ncbi:MBL fold metallo-hydrolase [Mycobacterium tuberculosis]|uniref:MBL fold metallo-hydrolase n=1 Tax=Mycobacterium tuberculosis TaxID=1773 RepID=UPI0005DB2546|nr:MBL fold metallo-hydrolase [Mycobacterium tuberculosis]CKY33597.1 metal dependent hydrolase [Mycobacterium tuberculosis]CKY43248.1 metal dependent hydrolase [Mycobacterium tuberculosis]